MNFEAQTLNKLENGRLDVVFTKQFSAPPIVIVTPYYTHGGVGSVETVTGVTATGCSIMGNNAGPDYYVNVLAIEKGTGQLDGTSFIAGQKLNTTGSVSIPFVPGFSHQDPIVHASPFWENSTGTAHNIETLNTVNAGEATVIGFTALGTNVNYLAMDRGLNANCMQMGTANKTGGGPMRVYFPKPFVGDVLPVVILTPWWNGANNSVSHIETVTNVTPDYFEFTSENGSSIYFVNWAAALPPVG